MPDKVNTSGLEIKFSQDFSRTYPGASVGLLVLENVKAQYPVENLDDTKREIIIGLKKQFPDLKTLKDHPIIKAYTGYYKKFDKSYHVLGQLASVIFENRPLPSGQRHHELASRIHALASRQDRPGWRERNDGVPSPRRARPSRYSLARVHDSGAASHQY